MNLRHNVRGKKPDTQNDSSYKVQKQAPLIYLVRGQDYGYPLTAVTEGDRRDASRSWPCSLS